MGAIAQREKAFSRKGQNDNRVRGETPGPFLCGGGAVLAERKPEEAAPREGGTIVLQQTETATAPSARKDQAEGENPR
jgi:hypothetical protein